MPSVEQRLSTPRFFLLSDPENEKRNEFISLVEIKPTIATLTSRRCATTASKINIFHYKIIKIIINQDISVHILSFNSETKTVWLQTFTKQASHFMFLRLPYPYGQIYIHILYTDIFHIYMLSGRVVIPRVIRRETPFIVAA